MSRSPWWPRHLPASAVIAGSIAPDIPIMAVFAGIGVWTYLSGGGGSTFAAFRAAYASDPLLVVSHQLLHAPISLAALYAAAVIAGQLSGRHGRWLRSFMYGTMVHSIVDIFTHVDDGPLLLWPFEATVRFASPISHWDASHCAALCVFVETIVCLWALHDALLARQPRGSNDDLAPTATARPSVP